MDKMTNQQLILLVLLVSFVTSIATGIITVSLLDTAPTNITQTIDRVIEHTVEKVTPIEVSKGQTQTVVEANPDSLEEKFKNIINQAKRAIVAFGDTESPAAIGVAINNMLFTTSGAQKASTTVSTLSNSASSTVAGLVDVPDSDLTFTDKPVGIRSLTDITLAPADSLFAGETVFALTGDSVLRGYITSISAGDTTTVTTDFDKNLSASLLVDVSGRAVGLASGGNQYSVLEALSQAVSDLQSATSTEDSN